MSLPPEKISVKRRRDEAAIETFYLEKSRAKKSRVDATGPGFRFKLIRGGALVPKSRQQASDTLRYASTQSSTSDNSLHGIPVVRATAPSDEISDFEKFRQLQHPQPKEIEAGRNKASVSQADYSSAKPQLSSISHARRFHLTRHLSSSFEVSPRSGPLGPVGRGSGIRPPLPTFVERQHAELNSQEASAQANSPRTLQSHHTTSDPSLPSEAAVHKTGVSLDDPSQTWNRDSDQLANELAALAMDMDPEHLNATSSETSIAPSSTPQPRQDDDFIYETYIRMPYDSIEDTAMVDASQSSVGVLVIDEADEELWQEYMDSDEDDDDWDDEDSNAEDNPANDYPEEELSSDDEYDRNAYRFHKPYDGDDYDSEEEYS